MSSAPTTAGILLEGWARKKGGRRGIKSSFEKTWPERYFTLRPQTLSIYVRRGDLTPKSVIDLTSLDVSESVSVYSRSRKRIVTVSSIETSYLRNGRPCNPPPNPHSSSPNPQSTSDSDVDFTPDQSDPRSTAYNPDASSNRTRGDGRDIVPFYEFTIDWGYKKGPKEVPSTPLPDDAVTGAPSIDDDDDGAFEGKDNTQSWDDLDDPALNLVRQQRSRKLRRQKKMVTAAKVAAATTGAITVGVLTSGVGLIAGLGFIGLSSVVGGGGVVAANKISRKKSRQKLEEEDSDGGDSMANDATNDGAPQTLSQTPVKTPKKTKRGSSSITIGTFDLEEVTRWRKMVHECTVGNREREEERFWNLGADGSAVGGSNSPSPGASVTGTSRIFQTDTNDSSASTGQAGSNQHPASTHSSEIDRYMRTSQWTLLSSALTSNSPLSATSPLRIYKEASPSELPTLKAQIVCPSSPMTAFMTLMNLNRQPLPPALDDPVPASTFNILRTVDESTDILHIYDPPLYLFPSFTTPRDYIARRYWRVDDDGCYIITLDSVDFDEYVEGYIRGEIHSVYTISPKKGESDHHGECLITNIVQINPMGWCASRGVEFGMRFLEAMLECREQIETERFVNVYVDSEAVEVIPTSPAGVEIDDEEEEETEGALASSGGASVAALRTIANHPPPFKKAHWAVRNGDGFKVRGKDYKVDKKKVAAGEPMFRMIAADVIETDSPMMKGMGNNPSERVQQALKHERENPHKPAPKFTIVINFALPGPPFYHVAMYYAVDDMSLIDGTSTEHPEFSALCKEMFLGDNDEFCDRCYKLIPQIVEGNFIVRRAVGATPAILGMKLKQSYIRDPRFFELICDIGSSSVAAGVVRLSIGYARTLVVDLGHVLQGDKGDHLPEKMFGAVRFKNLDFDDPKFRFSRNY